MSRSVRQMFQCYECATCTTNLPDASGVSLCDRHKTGLVVTTASRPIHLPTDKERA
jgi:hypothetical protein